MDEPFTLSFSFRGIPQEIPCRLRTSAYTYQFLCTVGESEMILEKDDEGSLRAIEADPFSAKKTRPDPELIKELIAEMERILQ